MRSKKAERTETRRNRQALRDAIAGVTRQIRSVKLPVKDVWMTASRFYQLRGETLPPDVLPEDVLHWDGKTAHFEDDCSPECIRLG